MKKLPSQISNEELLTALDDTTVTEKPTEHTVLRFLSDFSITAGEEEVNGRTLYKLYYYHTEIPVSAVEFYLILCSYFKYQDNSAGRLFSLNTKAADITRSLAMFLAARKEIKKTKNPYFRYHFENFIASNGLMRGNNNLPAQALFYFYDRWQYENNYKTRLPYRTFIAMIRLYFDTKRTTRNWCVVKLNKSFLDSHKNDLQTAIEWGYKFNAYKKKDIFKKAKKKK